MKTLALMAVILLGATPLRAGFGQPDPCADLDSAASHTALDPSQPLDRRLAAVKTLFELPDGGVGQCAGGEAALAQSFASLGEILKKVSPRGAVDGRIRRGRRWRKTPGDTGRDAVVEAAALSRIQLGLRFKPGPFSSRRDVVDEALNCVHEVFRRRHEGSSQVSPEVRARIIDRMVAVRQAESAAYGDDALSMKRSVDEILRQGQEPF